MADIAARSLPRRRLSGRRRAFSDRCFGRAEHFLNCRLARFHFTEAVFAQRAHTAFNAEATELNDIWARRDLVAQEVLEHQHFVETHAA